MSATLQPAAVPTSPAVPATATAVVFDAPRRIAVREVPLVAPTERDVVVRVEWSGISTGTERLLFTGEMPPFPGLGYPLVPGYETVGRVVWAGPESGHREGSRVFLPGSYSFAELRNLFGGSASALVAPGARALVLDPRFDDEPVLLALGATAYHALVDGERLPDLVVGHGALGRLVARLVLALGGPAPTVWETNPVRRAGAIGYDVVDPAADARRDYACICDVSGATGLLDTLIGRLARGGEVVLAGFYHEPLAFGFPMAFMKGARLRIAAEWERGDLEAVHRLAVDGELSLDGLITHRIPAHDAEAAYALAFGDARCIKMVLDWRGIA